MNKKSAFCSAIAVLVICFTCASPAYPQYYSAATGNWNTGSTWVGGSVPVDGNLVGIEGGNTVTFSTGTYTTGGWDGGTFLPLGVGVNFGSNPGAGTLNITGGTLNANGLFVGHETASGTINQSSGTFNVYGTNTLIGWGSPAAINVSGGTLNMTGGGGVFRIGHVSAAGVNITGSGVVNLAGTIGLLSNSQINANGGTLNFNNAALDVGAGSQVVVQGGGVLNMLSGTQAISVAEGLWLGYGATTGTMNISGGTWQQNTYLRMGVFASGNGIINQTGGTFEMGSTFEAWGSSPSAYNLQGGTFRTTGTGVQINTYSGGPMTFNITGASGNVTMDTPYNFTAPNSSTFNNAAATLTKTGTGQLTVNGQLEIRNGGLSMQQGTLETVSQILIGSNGTASGTMTGGVLRTGSLGGSNFAVGVSGGTGSFTQSGGLTDVGSQANVVIGWTPGSVGTYTLTGGTFAANGNYTFVGYQGTGTVNVNGGSFSGYITNLGNSGGAGTLNVNGGSFATQSLSVGGNSSAAGTLNLSGGSFSVASGFTVDAGGTVNINSGGSMSGGASGNVTIQNGGLVKFNGGTGNASMNLFMGSGGTVDVNGQTLASGNWSNLIASATGAILTNSSASNATIANGNTIWLWDGGQNLTINTPAAALEIASWITSSLQATPTGIVKTGTGTLILSGNVNNYTGSTAVNAGTLQITNGSALGSTGTAGSTTVASGAQLRLAASDNNSGFTVGDEALSISGQGITTGGALRNATGINTWQGKVTLAADATIGAAGSTSLTLDVASGNAIEAANFNLTFDGAGTNRVNDAISLGTGGITKIGSGTTFLSAANSYSGATTISAGRLTLAGAGRLGSGTISVASANAGTLEFAVSGTYTVANAISGSGALVSSTGTTILTGNNSYKGTTTVSGGSLIVNGDNSSATGAVTVSAGALLGGSGTIGGATTINGTLSPGNSPGVITFGSVVLGGSSTTLIEINGLTRGSQYDAVNITGPTNSLQYGGLLSIAFGNGSPFADGSVFDIFSFTGGSLGSYASVTSTGYYAGTWSNIGGGQFQLFSGAQTLTFDQSTGDIVVVPEPAALALAGVGIVAAAAGVRRRRQK